MPSQTPSDILSFFSLLFVSRQCKVQDHCGIYSSCVCIEQLCGVWSDIQRRVLLCTCPKVEYRNTGISATVMAKACMMDMPSALLNDISAPPLPPADAFTSESLQTYPGAQFWPLGWTWHWLEISRTHPQTELRVPRLSVAAFRIFIALETKKHFISF